MREKIEPLIYFFVTLFKLIRPGGMKAVMVEKMALKQQILMMSRGKKRSPQLTTFDRFVFGFSAFFIRENRLQKVAVIFKPATILAFHKALVKRKYERLFSNKATKNRVESLKITS